MIAAANPGSNVIRAGKAAVQVQNQLLADRKSFAWETTLSGVRELRLMQAAKDSGFRVSLVYIGVNTPNTSMSRVAMRVLLGGHDVPNEDIERRFARSLQNLPKALEIADRTWVLDNSQKKRRLFLSRESGRTRHANKSMPVWLDGVLPESILPPESSPESDQDISQCFPRS